MSPVPGAATEPGPRHDFADGEFPFARGDFEALSEILTAESGIVLEPEKMSLVYSRLTRRLRVLGLRTFRSYCQFIAGEEGFAERRLMVEALTTNVTRFFRESHHFEHLQTEILPDLMARARRGARVRLWSAGCSSGEEPFTMALALLAVAPDAPRWDVRILATDINTQILARGRAGLYPDAAMPPIDPAVRDRWFQPVDTETGRAWQAGAELRGLVAFRTANLVDEQWPMSGPFQVVFCRNVVIYFHELVRRQVLSKLVDLMAPGGHLYIGHSERMLADEARVQLAGPTVYRKLDGPEANAPFRPAGNALNPSQEA